MLNIHTLWVKPMVRETGMFVLLFGGLALLTHLSGLDALLARLLYSPTQPWAMFLREYGALSIGVLAWSSLLVMFWPYLSSRNPLLYRSAAVIVITAVLGAGLLNQVVIKNMADRPRPRDTVLADTPTLNTTEFKGKSMPSGHAGLGFVLAAPFFVLRRQRPRTANLLLAAGLTWGSAVGVARMVAGAHFLSDVIIAALVTLASARLAAAALQRWPFIPRMALLTVMILSAAAFVLGNKFTLTLNYQATEPWHTLNLPCTLQGEPNQSVTNPTISLTLTGYGAPLSQLRIVNNHGTLRLRTEYGLYHHLACQGRLLVPASNE